VIPIKEVLRVIADASPDLKDASPDVGPDLVPKPSAVVPSLTQELQVPFNGLVVDAVPCRGHGDLGQDPKRIETIGSDENSRTWPPLDRGRNGMPPGLTRAVIRSLRKPAG